MLRWVCSLIATLLWLHNKAYSWQNYSFQHKGVPYCHVPCYGALFGPQLFGHGTRVESHKSFGNKTFQRPGQQNGPSLPRDHLESKVKVCLYIGTMMTLQN